MKQVIKRICWITFCRLEIWEKTIGIFSESWVIDMFLQLQWNRTIEEIDGLMITVSGALVLVI